LSDDYKQAIKDVIDLLMVQHEEAKGSHNYWHVAANLVQAEFLPEDKQVSYTGNGTAGQEGDVKPTGFFFQMPEKIGSYSSDTSEKCVQKSEEIRHEWVGLTDEEIQKCYETTGHYQTLRPQDRFAVFALARAIEAKLREKNGGAA
jgi:hypothetical protein